MKKRYTEAQIAFALRQAATGTPVADIVRKMGISDQTFYRWKKQFADMVVSGIHRLKELEEECCIIAGGAQDALARTRLGPGELWIPSFACSLGAGRLVSEP